jgi:hypothetical protein
MSNVIIEGLFLLAFWAPPLTVVACVLALLINAPSAQRSSAPAHVVPMTR